MRKLWDWFWNGTSKIVFATIVFFAGVIVWGGLNTVMEATNTMEFCISCHEMRDNVYVEYKETVHYQNTKGVRAICSDCHVPDSWGPKVARKIRASNEVFHWLMGTIDTKEKYEAHRLELAQKVWTEMKENNSRECRNCHTYSAMHWEKQSSRAKKWMQEAEKQDMACVECHKGVAHKLPDMPKAYIGMTKALNDIVTAPSTGDEAVAVRMTSMLTEPKEGAGDVATVEPLTTLKVLDVQGDWTKVELEAWDREGGTKLFSKAGQPMQVAKLGMEGMDLAKASDTVIDKKTELEWHKITVEGWLPSKDVTDEVEAVVEYAGGLMELDCNLCHQIYEPTRFNAFDWEREVKAMRRFTRLDEDQQKIVLKYLQANASDAAGVQ